MLRLFKARLGKGLITQVLKATVMLGKVGLGYAWLGKLKQG